MRHAIEEEEKVPMEQVTNFQEVALWRFTRLWTGFLHSRPFVHLLCAGAWALRRMTLLSQSMPDLLAGRASQALGTWGVLDSVGSEELLEAFSLFSC